MVKTVLKKLGQQRLMTFNNGQYGQRGQNVQLKNSQKLSKNIQKWSTTVNNGQKWSLWSKTLEKNGQKCRSSITRRCDPRL